MARRPADPAPFRLAGELDLASCAVTAARLHAHAAANDGDVVADCTDLEFLDSSGIATLVAFRAQLEQVDRHFWLIGIRGGPERALAMSGLLDWFQVPAEPAELTPTATEMLRHMAELHPHVLLEDAVLELALPEADVAHALTELCAAGLVGRTPTRPGIAEAFRITPEGRRKASRLN